MPKLWATERTACPLVIICQAWRLNSSSYLRRGWPFTFVFIGFIVPSNTRVRQSVTISNSIDDLAHLQLARSPVSITLGQQRFDILPLTVNQTPG